MLSILEEIYEKEITDLSNRLEFNFSYFKKFINNLPSSTNYAKGKALEDLVAYFFSCINEFKITGRNIRNFTEEIDLCLCNCSNNALFWELGPIVLVECKNQHEKINVKTIRNLSSIMEVKGISTTILVTASVLTKPAIGEIEKAKLTNKNIIVIYLNELLSLNKTPLRFLEDKILEYSL